MDHAQFVAAFLESHSGGGFRHAEELLAALRQGACTLHAEPRLTACKALIDIYRRREKHLRQFDSVHARALRDDVVELNKNFESMSKDAECRGWSFEFEGGVTFAVFEEPESFRVLGCIRAVSKLKVSKEEWERLWRDG